MASSTPMTIPTLSFPTFTPNELLSAAAKTGFFYLTDLPVELGLVEEAWKASEALFLTTGDDAEQQRLTSRDREAHTGYTMMHEEKLDLSNLTQDEKREGDYKESFYIAQLGLSPPRQTLPSLLTSYEGSLKSLFEQCRLVCAHVLRQTAKALHMADEEYFASKHNAFDDRLRLIHYPPASVRSADDDSIRAGAHTDYGSLTLLFQRGVSGLQVKLDDEWIDVPPPPVDARTVVVNVADALEFWTGGVLQSAQHRVSMPRCEREARSRFSIAFFCQPDADALLTPLPCAEQVEREGFQRRSREAYEAELRRKGIPSPNERLTGGEHLQSRLRASYAT